MRTRGTAAASDQVYYAASAENAMMDRSLIEERVADAIAGVDASTEQIRRGIDRIRLVTERT